MGSATSTGQALVVLCAYKLIILTSVQGVYDKHPDDPHKKLISIIDPSSKKGWPDVSTAKSVLGRGGMISKLDTARKMSYLGTTTHIASMREPDVLIRILNGVSLGTTVLPRKKKSNIKRWIAVSGDHNQGTISINTCLFEALKENNCVLSILPVGIARCEGDFKKGDLVDILAPEGQKIGTGIARYNRVQLNEYMGCKGKPAFIHYNHLHMMETKQC